MIVEDDSVFSWGELDDFFLFFTFFFLQWEIYDASALFWTYLFMYWFTLQLKYCKDTKYGLTLSVTSKAIINAIVKRLFRCWSYKRYCTGSQLWGYSRSSAIYCLNTWKELSSHIVNLSFVLLTSFL